MGWSDAYSKIYIDKVRYAKAGVMLSGICQHDEVQLDMFNKQSESEGNKRSELMALVDELNSRFQHDRNQQATVFIASEGIKKMQTWQMSRELLSPCYTTRVSDLVVVK